MSDPSTAWPAAPAPEHTSAPPAPMHPAPIPPAPIAAQLPAPPDPVLPTFSPATNALPAPPAPPAPVAAMPAAVDPATFAGMTPYDQARPPAGTVAPPAPPVPASPEARAPDGSHAALWDPTPDIAPPSDHPGEGLHELELPDASGTWWSPGTALIVATFALAFQLCAYYAREVLPARIGSGASLDNLDKIIDHLGVLDAGSMTFVGAAIAISAVALVGVGHRRGLREPLLQGAVAVIALVSVAAPFLVPLVA